MTLNDLEPTKYGGYSDFIAILGCGAHFESEIATKWLEIDQEYLRMKFSASNVDFSQLGLFRPPRFKQS